MWSSPMVAKVPSKQAYLLTLERLDTLKRGNDFPTRGIVQALKDATAQPFLAKTPWYDAQAVARRLASFAKDPVVDPRVRQDAVGALAAMEGRVAGACDACQRASGLQRGGRGQGPGL